MARQKRDYTGFGEWLRAQRDQRAWTQVVAIARLHELTDTKVTRNWLSQLENGDPPSDDLARAWERLYGPFTAPVAVSAPDDLLAALTAQTAAITDLVAEMRLARSEEPEWMESLLATLAALRQPGGSAGSDEPPASGVLRQGQG